jgi:hypothetical protein
MVALLVAGGLFYRSHKTQALTEKDSILLSDFTNTTGFTSDHVARVLEQ